MTKLSAETAQATGKHVFLHTMLRTPLQTSFFFVRCIDKCDRSFIQSRAAAARKCGPVGRYIRHVLFIRAAADVGQAGSDGRVSPTRLFRYKDSPRERACSTGGRSLERTMSEARVSVNTPHCPPTSAKAFACSTLYFFSLQFN